MSLWQQILNWDRDLFHVINSRWTNPVFDKVLPYARNAIIWIPFYVFILSFAAINFKRKGLFWMLFGILTVASADILSSWVVKELIFRLRPCRDEALAGTVRFLVNYCPQSSGFTSSHATNHFAMAMFIFITLRKQIGKWLWAIFFWAFLIGYAQVYVGVHYPFDIVGGSILGMAIGYGWGIFFNRQFPLDIVARPKPELNEY
jgi:membrane-associated phospholipid phosphatase